MIILALKSVRMGIERKMLRNMCGIISDGGTGIGKCVKTGSRAATIGIKRIKFNELWWIKNFASFVTVRRISMMPNRVISRIGISELIAAMFP